MNPIDRVLTALSFKEPDRVPLVQSLTIYGAKELGITIEDYYSNPLNVVEAQVLMQKKYSNDCYLGVYYGAAEFEAFGGKVIFSGDGPPNAGSPVINSFNDIENLKDPEIEECKILQNILQTIKLLKEESNGKIPILGLVISPFSLPVMQMGFEKYLDLIITSPLKFWKLMEINKRFAIRWANMQLEAGATAIGFVDPVSSPTIISKKMFLETGFKIAKDVIPAIKGATATSYASGLSLQNMEELVQTGTAMFAVSSKEDIGVAKRLSNSRLAIMGNLNGIEMCRWDKKDTENAVKDIIKKAAKGGGFVLTDNHGEIPLQVPEAVLLTIAEAVDKYGQY